MLAPRPADWHLDALCAQVDPELFFPEKGGSAAAAKRICSDCLVKERCLQEALDRKERHGVWGGTVPNERLMMLRQKNPDFVWVDEPLGPRDRSGGGAWTAATTHCNRGHELTPENVMIVKDGRRCRECKRMADARARRTRRQWREEQCSDRTA